MTSDSIKTLEQEVLHNNKEIFARIVKELEEAEAEILIASAWFTDNELFDILITRLKDGLKIELIIADNQENEKLDFPSLTAMGASVTKIKNVGYGIMHQKFCVIDKRLALHGSYNWSNNAKKNNHESIIVTNHQGTVESLIANFEDIKQKAADQKAGIKSNSPIVLENPVAQVKVQVPREEIINEYEKVLDSMIAAEVGNFDRSLLRKQGYERAKSNNGDHQVLKKSLDTVYSVFINEIDVVDDKKRRLQSKIDEQKIKSINGIKQRLSLQLEASQTEFEVMKMNLNNRIINNRAQILIKEQEKSGIIESKIPAIERTIGDIKERIKLNQLEFIKPAFKYFELIPSIIINLGLFLYLFFFYSSAAYILLFSTLDAEVAQLKSINITPPEIFNPYAFSNAWDKGGAAPFFIIFFVFLPITFALAGRFIKNQIVANVLSFGFGIIVIDGAIAFKVAQSIHHIDKLRGATQEEWYATKVFQDTNFYLVFIMGALGLLLFKFTYNKLIEFFEDRNPDIAALKSRLQIKQLLEDIETYNDRIMLANGEHEAFEKEAITLKSEILISELELESIPLKRASLLEIRNNECNGQIQKIDRVTDVYKSHIDNDNLPISVDSLKDRINVFLEGWNDLLHDEYSVPKAIEKSQHASVIATEWQNAKLDVNRLDKRIKL
jgi:hypothetical protein